jgi:hypothetical protein
MFFGGFSGFRGKSTFPVAVSRHACRVLATVGVLGLASCATPPADKAAGPAPSTPQAKQSLVSERANARWDAMVKDDLDAAYAFMSPGSRETTSLEKFKANTRRGAFRAAKIESTTCDGDVCIVKLFVTYDHPKMKGITTPVAESWIIDGGQAWLVYGGR